MQHGLTLIIPCYNETTTIRQCVERCLALKDHDIDLELLIVDDCSRDDSVRIIQELQKEHPEISLYRHTRNMGKGAALRTGFLEASREYVGIQDADMEYNPLDYLALIKPLAEGRADVVYGSRYLKKSPRRVLRFWHSFMNRGLTVFSNLFTDMDLTDMETCYKLFRRETIRELAPRLRENRFGFEPEITCLVSRSGKRLCECAIDYFPRGYEEGKKIGWKDGVAALYCILHYGAPFAPAPLQFLIYFFIGAVCAIANIATFALFMGLGLAMVPAIVIAFILAALLNYLLCLAILFRHKSRWSGCRELLCYGAVVVVMCVADVALTLGFNGLGCPPVVSKTLATVIGFIGNFLLRKFAVFATPKSPL